VKGKTARTLTNSGQTHKYRFSITLKKGETMYVAFKPFHKDKGHAQFIVELNPNKLGPEGLEDARAVLRQFFEDDYDRVMSAAFITLLDYFADYPVMVNEVFIEMPRKETCATWGLQFNADWLIKTIYLGGGGSDGQVKVYDKVAEAIAATAANGRDGTIDEVLDASGNAVGSRMRIEARRFPRSLPLSKLHTLDNPFSRVSIAKIGSDAKEFQEPLGRCLLLAARAFGWQVALKTIGDANAIRRYRHAFVKYRCEWWGPDRAAVDVAVAVLKTGLFPEDAFDGQVAGNARSSKPGKIRTFDRKQFDQYKREKKEQGKLTKHTASQASEAEDAYLDVV